MSVSAARGPLTLLMQSAGSQWVMIGFVGVSLFGGDKVRDLIQENLLRALSLTASPNNNAAAIAPQSHGPIVIHTGSNAGLGSKNGLTMLVIQISLGAASCWAAYACLSNLMPEFVKDAMPVNRSLFDRAVKSLGEGIIHVRDSLSEQIQALVQGQEELGEKQDRTLSEVGFVRDDLAEALGDLARLDQSLSRCESSLTASQRLHDYTSRGVRLLVRCVANVMPGNDRALDELLQYIREAERIDNAQEQTAVSRVVAQGPPENEHPALPENEHPALVSMSRDRPKENSYTPVTPMRNEKMDALHSLLADTQSSSYKSPMVQVK